GTFQGPYLVNPFVVVKSAERPALCYCGRTKLYVTTPFTFTGTPLNKVGEKRARRAAETEAACNSGCPLIACALITFPDSSIRTCTVTVPAALACMATGGYSGGGKYNAFPFNTPPLITCGSADDLSVGAGVSGFVSPAAGVGGAGAPGFSASSALSPLAGFEDGATSEAIPGFSAVVP